MAEAEPGPDLVAPPSHDLPRMVVASDRRIRAAALEANVTLRLTGSLAVWERCPSYASLLGLLGRRQYRDLDYFAYSSQTKALEAVFNRLGYVLDPTIRQSQEFGVKRYIYHDRDTSLKIDIFLDELVMAHNVDLKGRLELHPDTLSIVDLLLSKLQIHEITENDLIDLVVLFAEYDPMQQHEARSDAQRLVRVLADDWGFYHTALGNLTKIEVAFGRYHALPSGVRDLVGHRVENLRTRLEAAPKSTRWKLRARVGERFRWYNDVDEVRT
jgi:hypothetical protein